MTSRNTYKMPPSKGSSLAIWLLICTLCLVLGWILGKAVTFGIFEVDPQINVVDVVSILVTILAAVILGVVIDKRKLDGRSMKDLFIGKANKIEAILETLESEVARGPYPLGMATASLKRMNVTFIDLCKRLQENGISVPPKIGTDFKNNLRTLKDRLTNTPPVGTSDTSITIHQDTVTLSPSRLALAKSDIDKIESNLFQLQLVINQS